MGLKKGKKVIKKVSKKRFYEREPKFQERRHLSKFDDRGQIRGLRIDKRA